MIDELKDITSFKWGTITQVAPLRVRLDGDTAALLLTPDNLAGTLAVDDRVRVEMSERKIVIHGKAGGNFYNKAELNAGQLDTRYYTETEVNALFKKAVRGVIPSSIVVGSGSASADSDGLITFTNVGTTLSLNNVFDGLNADIYQIFMGITQVGTSQIYMRLRASGTDQAGSIYDRTGSYTTLSSGPTRSSSAATTVIGYVNPASVEGIVSTVVSIFEPGISSHVTRAITDSVISGGGDRRTWHEGGTCDPGTAYDGISIIPPSGGTMTGYIKVVKIA